MDIVLYDGIMVHTGSGIDNNMFADPGAALHYGIGQNNGAGTRLHIAGHCCLGMDQYDRFMLYRFGYFPTQDIIAYADNDSRIDMLFRPVSLYSYTFS